MVKMQSSGLELYHFMRQTSVLPAELKKLYEYCEVWNKTHLKENHFKCLIIIFYAQKCTGITLGEAIALHVRSAQT